MKRKKSGFTIIELLITVAVIAVLAGLLLPALNAAKLKAQTVRCSGNLRQLGTFLLFYTEQNDSCLPAYNGNEDGYSQGKWIDCAYSIHRHTVVRDHAWLEKQGTLYVAKEPFRCPSAAVTQFEGSGNLRYIVARHYGMNGWLSKSFLPRIANPSQRSLLFDMDQPGVSAWVNPEARNADGMVNRSEGGSWRHYSGAGANVLFVDGHVSGMRESAIRAANPKIFW